MHGGTRLNANTALLSEMVDRLGDLANNFVFVGGRAAIPTGYSQLPQSLGPYWEVMATYAA
jgi:hypothetical protein